MHILRLLAFGLVLAILLPLTGCGNASSIETGVPSNIEPPKDFDPGGGVVPDMKGGRPKSPVP